MKHFWTQPEQPMVMFQTGRERPSRKGDRVLAPCTEGDCQSGFICDRYAPDGEEWYECNTCNGSGSVWVILTTDPLGRLPYPPVGPVTVWQCEGTVE